MHPGLLVRILVPEMLSPLPTAAPPIDVNQVFEDFTQTPEMVSLKADLDRACYWRAGGYSFAVNLVTDQPKKTYAHPGSFELSENDVQALRSNLDAILRTWCNVPIPYAVPAPPAVPYKLSRP